MNSVYGAHYSNGIMAPRCVTGMAEYPPGFQHMPGSPQEISTYVFYHYTQSSFVLYCEQIAACNVILLDVQLSSRRVRLGIVSYQYGSLPRLCDGSEPC